ncbi:MAG: STAS domain-containing protein [Planctomycetota bacterium]
MPVQEWSDDIWVAKLAPDPAFTDDIDEMLAALERKDLRRHLVADLSGVDRVNSSNLSSLLRARKAAIDTDRKLVIAGPTDRVWAVFLATGLDKVFDFAEDTAMALAQLQISGDT